MKNHYYFTFTLCAILNSNIIFAQDNSINMEWNEQYKNSVGLFEGKLTDELKDSLMIQLRKINPELNPKRKILINYVQKGQNCLMAKSEDYKINSLNFIYKESHDITRKRKSQNFFIFKNNTEFSTHLIKNEMWSIDSGFYKTYFFPSNQNCCSFAIIYPSGYYYIYYGEDYFTIVDKLLKKKK